MLDLLNKKYTELEEKIKNKNNIDMDVISIYTSILGYYAAKIDLQVNMNSTEKLKDKIMIQSFDKKLIQKLNLSEYMDNFIKVNSDSLRREFYDSIDFLKLTNHINGTILIDLKEDFDSAYLATVLNQRQEKLNIKEQNKIYKKHQKIYKKIEKMH